MALRVLLADESVTIKKVFQLSLQDFGVDVFAVTSGLDVLPIAKKNRPDIVFVDVILPKKSGYDVAAEIKKDPELKNVPVVIIWSGFMELDQARFKACNADAHLEKPFDTQRLRQIVQSLVKKTSSQTLSEFLQFPKLPDFKDEAAAKLASMKAAKPPPTPAPTPAPPEDSNVVSMRGKQNDWNMDHFAPVPSGTSITQVSAVPDSSGDGEFSELADDFVPVELPPQPPVISRSDEDETDADSDNQWIQKTLSRYKVEAPKTTEQEVEVSYREPTEKIDAEALMRNERPQPKASPTDDDEIELDLGEPVSVQPEPTPQLSDKQLEAIIRAQSKEMIEKVIWQVVPEIASQIIEREIQRLLKERQDIGPR